jgi:tRNA-dihydrouridine synthase
VDGVTIARGCIGNPWIFDECLALSRGDALPDPPTIAEQGRVIDEHYDEALALYGQGLASRIMRKFGIKYSEHHPLSMQVRDAFVAVKNDAGFRAVLAEWYDERRDWPVVRRREGHGDLVAAGARA